ncbi:hypothetical protein SAMN04487969_110176 [Paenibacillus algorifonticola]|uniref:Uncharacterized protein n=1 Tax=Paenibacillus algorifonticola TaxID=684063 RepID=A0A1I2EZX8_9BACL|nr:ribonuclease H-like YkuK family protein [Paenibacillus algorifonticola]SFE98319.1 hypothetical protein SAMN04487969_110176 [Paenibacillus algorifonticola]
MSIVGSNQQLIIPEGLSFQNVTESRLTFQDVSERICSFIAGDVHASYHFVVGTDSQVFRGYTKFVTGVVIRRIGKGAWACYRQTVVPKEMMKLREKLTLETVLSQEVAYYFKDGVLQRMEDLLLPYVYQGASLAHFIDIDAGTVPSINETSLYVQEMVERVQGMGTYAARVKPDSYVASSYANRFTKKAVPRYKRRSLL